MEAAICGQGSVHGAGKTGSVVTAKSQHSWGPQLPVHWLQDALYLKGNSKKSHRRPVPLSLTSTQNFFLGPLVILRNSRPLSPRRSLFCSSSQLWLLVPSARPFSRLKSGSLRVLVFLGIQKTNWTHLGKLWPTFHSNVLFLKVLKMDHLFLWKLDIL